MKESKNGFTLVELLAVIAIIAILGITAVAAYNGITQNAKEKAYEAKVKQIEIAAAKWAEENNVSYKTQVSVNKLIVQGYLQADAITDEGEALIENPVNGQNMICKVVNLSRKEGTYNAEFVSSKENCNLADQAIYDEKIVINATGVNGQAIGFSDNYLNWTNQNISLFISSPDFDESVVSISYDFDGDTVTKEKSGSLKYEPIKNGDELTYEYQATDTQYYNVYNVSADIILNNSLVVTYTLNDGSIYSRTVVIRIDKETPTFVSSSANDWIAIDKPITVYVDDGEGSGVKGFYISKDKNNLGTLYETDYKHTVNITETGTYYVKVVDNVGNSSDVDDSGNTIIVNNVDKTTPSCEVNYIGTLGENNWYISKVVPNITSNVAGLSGMNYGYGTSDVENYDSGHIYDGDSLNINLAEVGETSSKTYYCFVKSLAGKKGKNSKEVKVDITKPTITSIKVSSQDTSYASEKVNVEISANDTTSGLWKMCLQDNNNVNSCNWIDYKTTGKVTISNGNTNGGTAYVYAWVKDKAGNVSEIKKSDGYSLYKNCTETVNDGTYTCGTYSGCTNVCGGGTEYATKTQKKKDKYTGAACSSVITESGCSQSCGGYKYKDGTTCSDKCSGSGTLNRLAYSTVDGSRCSSYDVSNGGSACGGVTYKDGTTCSNACGGTYNRLAYSTFDGSRCATSYDKASGGSACGGIKTDYTYGSWSSWSTCSNACGGTQTRTRTGYRYSTDGTKTCSDAKTETDTQNCGGINTNYTYGSWSSWSTCSDACGGTQTRTRVGYKYSTDGTKTCSDAHTDTGSQSCGGKKESYTGASCVVPSSATCSNTCGTGTKTGTKTGTWISNDGTKTCTGTAPTQSCTSACTSYTADTTKPTVSDVTLTVDSASSATVTFSASDNSGSCKSGLDHYVVELAGEPYTITDTSVKTHTFTGITTQGEYRAKVTAYDKAGNSVSKYSSYKCIAGSYRITKKTYSVGDTVTYICDSWTVIKNHPNTAVLVLNRPMNKADVELAGIDTDSTAIVDGCNSTACKISHCAWSSSNPNSSYCWVKGNRTTGDLVSTSTVAYRWTRSYIRKVVESYLENNYLLKQARDNNHLYNMSFNDGIADRTGYIRIPTMEEVAGSTGPTWIAKSNPNNAWSWTLTKHANSGDGAISIDRYYWTILGHANTVGRIYPVIRVKKLTS